MQKILINRIRCKKCNDIIESMYRHDFKSCKCGAVAVDGGKDYIRRGGDSEDWEELSEYEDSSKQLNAVEQNETGNEKFFPKRSLQQFLDLEMENV